MNFLKALFQKGSENKALILVYKDLAQPGVRQVGIAIKNILSFVLFPFSDLPEYLTKRWKSILKHNLNRFREKLAIVEENKIEQVPNEIGIPIVQKLTYVQDEDISEMFINLLTKASIKEASGLAHPSFINCINNMSSDEAKILIHLKDNLSLPYVILRYQFNNEEFLDKTAILTGLEFNLELRFRNNIAMYVENLTGLGLIKREFTFLTDEKRFYTPLFTLYEPIRAKLEEEGHGGKQYPVVYSKGYYSLTPYGGMFIKACLKDIEKKEE